MQLRDQSGLLYCRRLYTTVKNSFGNFFPGFFFPIATYHYRLTTTGNLPMLLLIPGYYCAHTFIENHSDVDLGVGVSAMTRHPVHSVHRSGTCNINWKFDFAS
ncbi:PREDICTED: uncharacterized protein LOC107170627 [Diuraphis noxia]|uniref:uncharacterized protein LOC107170627 n=1 Tax=Diuraphis noxia TaxID=143948 RepID=UPI000763728F|nr:PREDICTED: uncharacterized protein LOC107170627 [Diuraphis noxia]